MTAKIKMKYFTDSDRSIMRVDEKSIKSKDSFITRANSTPAITRISLFEKELYELYRREETETPKRIKLAYTLLFAAALSIVIILL